MFAVTGFRVTRRIYEGATATVYGAIREADQRPVVLKVLKDAHPEPAAIARFERELTVLRGLSIPGVIEVLDLIHASDHWILIEQDLGAVSLAELGIAGHVAIDRVLRIALALASVLAALHGRGVVHKHLTPSNILLDPASDEVVLIDFELAATADETVAFAPVARLEGTPAYLSPEQTGRTDRSLDARSDLYSLGCVLYELITGQPPFTSCDLLELVHGHLARAPRPPHDLRADVPPDVSGILLKLLAKSPDDRYQSATGLRADLAARLAQRSFTLGAADVTSRFRLPARLYGRDAELARLRDVYARAAAGEAVLVLISGHAGMGKSALVSELYIPVTRDRGRFAAGKFDQYARDVPYAAFVVAFDALARQLLCEGDSELAAWRDRLRRALGPSCAALVDVVPSLAQVLGSMPPAAALPALEAHQRFLRSIRAFLEVCANAEHPLVLVLDDLQWADPASLELLREITAAAIPHLLVLGAYRDVEIDATHPLRVMLPALHAEVLALAPLTVADTAQLLGDALAVRDVAPLAALVHAKTDGNPFFIGELCKSLVADQLLRFDHAAGRWTWELATIHARDLSANVAALLVAKLARLPDATRTALQWAACLGGRFTLRELALATGDSVHAIGTALAPAIAAGFALALTSALDPHVVVEYRFAHDRLHQAAYTSVASADQLARHLAIARRLDAAHDPIGIARHYNLAAPLIADPAERVAAARHDLVAGDVARRAMAYASALNLFLAGLELLGPTGFAVDYDLCLTLTARASAAAYLRSDFDVTERLLAAGLSSARCWNDKVDLLQIRINALTAQDRLHEAIAVAREALNRLGVMLPDDPTQADVEDALGEVEQARAGRAYASLLVVPAAAMDAPHRSALRILDVIHATTMMAQQRLAPIVAARMVQLTLRHGRTDESISGYIYLCTHLCSHGQISDGYHLAQLARELCRAEVRTTQLAELVANGFYYVFHWREPIHALAEAMSEGYRAAWEAGHATLAASCLGGSVAVPFLAGAALGPLVERMSGVVATVEGLGQTAYAQWLRAYHQCMIQLIEPGSDPTVLRGAAYDETERVPAHLERFAALSIQLVNILKIMLCYRLDQPEIAVELFRREVDQRYPAAGVLLPPTLMYYCLALLALCDTWSGAQRHAAISEVRDRLVQLRRWSTLGPMNYSHKCWLVEAELARVTGSDAMARELYDRAIDLAREHGYLNEESLALERAALFYLASGNPRLAGYYMRDAGYAYQRWGARGRRAQLRARYPELLPDTASALPSSDLDLEAVVRASRALGREHDPAALLRQVLAICLEYAGAEHGCLVLVRAGELIVKASGERSRIALTSETLDAHDGVSRDIVRYVARTGDAVVLGDARAAGSFTHDPYVQRTSCRSVLCLPLDARGTRVAVVYMENTSTANAFTTERLGVLELVMSQAAVSLENALLRDDGSDFSYAVGGSLSADTPSYVIREADRLLVDHVMRGELCYVFNARQMGKSSLRVHAMARLVRDGFCCTAVDLSAIGSDSLTAEQWFAGIARVLASDLAPGLELRGWWRERTYLSPVQRLFELFDELLARIAAPIAIFIDEIDMVLGRAFSPDDFFALIRALYHRRADQPRYRRLSFVLIGVATPAELIQDGARTPFNIGRAIPMAGFQMSEARILTRGLTDFARPEDVLRAIVVWTEGQPFLTQKLCALARAAETRPRAGSERAWVSTLVRRRMIEQWRALDEPVHLRTIEARVLRSPRRTALLARYREILIQEDAIESTSVLDAELALSGLVVAAWERVRVGNPIYAAVFDQAWIHASLE